jgi:FkbM family methyltransferase
MNVIKSLAKSMGYELVKRHQNPSIMFHLIDLTKLNQIDLVLDVGANIGQFASEIMKAGYTGEVHSFEPVKNTFKELDLAASGNSNWHVHNFAMGETQGESEINVSNASNFSSMLNTSDYGKERYKKSAVEYTEIIQINTIDSFLKENITNLKERRILLKTDTQGFDLQVIEGAQESMSSVHCLLCEISLIPIYEGMPNYLDSLKAFESHGFIATGFYPISRNRANLALIEMDCVMIKGT